MSNKALRAALEFYRNPFAWKKLHDPHDDVRVPDFYSETSFGDTAAEALANNDQESEAAEIEALRGHLREMCDMVAPTVKSESRLSQGLSSALIRSRAYLAKAHGGS